MLKHLAVDIGASSGRLIVGEIKNGQFVLSEIHRFSNGAAKCGEHLVWESERLFSEILVGLKKCKAQNQIPATLGIDTWGVDYALLDKNDKLIGQTVAYRDERTKGLATQLEKTLPFNAHFNLCGIAKQPFNTVYQLMAEDKATLEEAKCFLMMPDYLNFLLTGLKANEYTNASTTGLLNAREQTWDKTVLAAAGINPSLFNAQLSSPATVLGPLKPEIAKEIGFELSVILPATHDTGSAYMAVPAKDENTVYLSSGTWSLLGLEIDTPLTDPGHAQAGFTNEGGYDKKIRFLKNIMGLWILQSIRAEWHDKYTFAEMADLAAQGACYQATFDANDASLMAPPSMLNAVTALIKKGGYALPENDSELLYAIYKSLALCYRDAVRDLQAMTKKAFTSMNIVGGGSNNKLLNQMIADALQIPVYAGPSEGTALGNLIAQMLATGEIDSLKTARAMIKTSFEIQKYIPKEA